MRTLGVMCVGPGVAGGIPELKISVWLPGKRFRLTDAVGYWEGEI
jgi:hypothetical protein